MTTLHQTNKRPSLKVSNFHTSPKEVQNDIWAAFREKMKWHEYAGCTVEGSYGSVSSLMKATFIAGTEKEFDVCITYGEDSTPTKVELGSKVYLYLLSGLGYEIDIRTPEQFEAIGKSRVVVRKACRSQKVKVGRKK